MSILPAVTLGVLAILSGTMLWVARALFRRENGPEPVVDHSETGAAFVAVLSRVAENEDEIAKLRLAVEHGIERVDRAEKRVQKTVASARRLVASSGVEHAGLEAEDEELRERNGEAVEALPAVQPELVDDRPTGIPGISRSRLNELRENWMGYPAGSNQ